MSADLVLFAHNIHEDFEGENIYVWSSPHKLLREHEATFNKRHI